MVGEYKPKDVHQKVLVSAQEKWVGFYLFEHILGLIDDLNFCLSNLVVPLNSPN